MTKLILILVTVFPLYAQTLRSPSEYLNTSYARAAKLINAARNGDVSAQFDVGMMHEKGDVVPQNHKEAVRWFRMSAEGGFAPAQLFLGLMYSSGKGIPKDNTEAVKWIGMAAEQGNHEAATLLGGMYFSDHVVDHDYVLAYKYSRIAALTSPDAKDTNAPANLDGLAHYMTPEQVTEAERLVQQWTTQHHAKQ